MTNRLRSGLLSIIAAFAFAGSAGATTIEQKTPEVNQILPQSTEFVVGDDGVYYAISSELRRYDPDTQKSVTVKDFCGAAGGMITPKDLENGLFLYEQSKDLFLFNFETRETKRITHDRAEKGRAVLSTDGKLVAYATELYGDSDIFLYDTETGETKAVAKTKEDETDPQFFIDSHHLSYVTGEAPQEFATRIYSDDKGVMIAFMEDVRGEDYNFVFLRKTANPNDEDEIIYMKPIGGDSIEGRVYGEFTSDARYFILNNGKGTYSINTEELFE